MRVVVTGASGNVGTAVLARLRADPEIHSIVGISRRRPDLTQEPFRDVDWRTIDVGASSDQGELRRALAGADAVIHLAWALQPNHDERMMRRTNVIGTLNLLDAAATQQVGQVVVASSVGAYSVGPKRRRVDESWPTGGLPTSHYARYKAMNERAMDVFEKKHPDIILTRMRPGLIFQGAAGAEIAGLFLGRFFPTGWLGGSLPVLPLPTGVVVQAVHSHDVADAYARAVTRRAGGPFNIAAEPVLTPELLARAFGAERTVPFRASVLRAIVDLTWRLRIQATEPGWLDIALSVPVMSTERARSILGWSPTVTATEAVAEVVGAIASRETLPAAPPLR